MQTGRIKAVLSGGGGVTHGTDPMLEAFLVSRLGDRPRIGYLGTANADNPERLERVRRRFGELGAEVRHLPTHAAAEEAEGWSRDLDAIYVGGGHTERMLRTWRDTGIDHVLRGAAQRGVVMSGVSAGAVCWFDFALWDGAGTGFRPLEGLGVIAGSCCPHFTTEPERAAAYRAHLADGRIPAGYAIGDGAALVLSDEHVAAACIARSGSGVWRADRSDNGARLTPLPSA
jgi:peptidase E